MAEESTRSVPILAPPSRTLSEHIADQLRQAILSHQLKPGQRIVEGQIAKAMDTSRGPVRDALLLLENEGIVVRYAHRGTFVAQLSLEDAEEIYSLRQAIESVALEYLIKNATPQQIDELEAHVEKMAAMACQPYDPWEVTELDLEFHRALCRLSGHGRALDAWQALSAQTRILLLGHRTRNPHEFEERGVEGHRRLVEALRQRDADRAQEELREHLAAAVEGLLNSSREEQVQAGPP
jgi:DNA-binding GntR family transcriptional regulator